MGVRGCGVWASGFGDLRLGTLGLRLEFTGRGLNEHEKDAFRGLGSCKFLSCWGGGTIFYGLDEKG